VDTSDFHALLVARLGIDAAIVGPSFLPAVVRRCMHDAGTQDVRAYAAAVAAGGDAWEALVEAVVVQETWFFRDPASFDELVGEVRARWQGPGAPPVRILSCPCSTGEEPYSAAIALLDAGLPPEAFEMHAVDVSRRAIAAAARGEYRARAFRDGSLLDRTVHLAQDAGTATWRVSAQVRGRVSLGVGNLVTGDGLDALPCCDVVLCRNLLIYLHEDGRARAVATLKRLLAPGGLLIVGHADPAIVRAHGFRGTGAAAAFAFRAGSDVRVMRTGSGPAVRAAGGGPAPRRVLPRARAACVTTSPVAETADAAASCGGPPARTTALAHVRQLADQGRIEDALRLCVEYVDRVRDSADGHFLLGVLHDAAGHHPLAVEAFRRALYVDPRHEDALRHLALKLEARGDGDGAARLRARADRAAHAHAPGASR
jgi:chemotaxis protein methyltransferase WspC